MKNELKERKRERRKDGREDEKMVDRCEYTKKKAEKR